MRERLLSLKDEVFQHLEQVASDQEVEQLRTTYLGRKGKLTAILRSMKDLPEEERPVIGTLANQVKQELSAALDNYLDTLKNSQREKRIAREKPVSNRFL